MTHGIKAQCVAFPFLFRIFCFIYFFDLVFPEVHPVKSLLVSVRGRVRPLFVLVTKYYSHYQLLLWTDTGGKVLSLHGNGGTSETKTMLGMQWKYLLLAKCHTQARCS